MAGRRIAIVLFNLGGPDAPKAVRPFLFNLFKDPAIIGLPAPARLPLAALISTARAKSARANYAIMGGASPLLPETRKQSAALQALLGERLAGDEVRCFIAMRYWRPLTDEAAREVKAFAPDEIVVLPLYPQFSTTTTQSSIAAWKAAYKGPGRSREVCCYPRLAGMVESHVRHIRTAMEKADGPFRLLFSAHGLPEKVVKAGDPYQRQIEATAAAIVERLAIPDLDWQVCYQSRVGPLAWIGPSTMEAIEGACNDGLGVVIAPIAFVSEHIETLVELDHDYHALADGLACPSYVRVPALGIEEAFIGALAEAALAALERASGAAPAAGWSCGECGPVCPAQQAELSA